MVIDQPVPATGALRELVHDLGHDARHREMEWVLRLTSLEEHVGVLRSASHDRCLGSEAPLTKGDDVAVANERAQVVVVEQRDLVDLVRRAEAVEEMQERHARAEGRGVGDQREVVRLLHGTCREHRPTGRAGVHDVAVIAEDRQRVRGDRARGNMHDARSELSRDLEHVRDHEQQALRRSERRSQRTGLQRAVQRARGTGFGLHLHDVGNRPPEVRSSRCRPVVGVLAHRRSGRDGIEGDDLAQGVGHACRCLVPV